MSGNMRAEHGLLLSLGVAAAGAVELMVVDRFFNEGLTAPALLALAGIAAIFLGLLGASAFLLLWYFDWGLDQRIGIARLLAGPLLVLLGLTIIPCGLYSVGWLLGGMGVGPGRTIDAEARGYLIVLAPFVLAYVAIFGSIGVMCLWAGLRQFRS
jgi:hypothetical protein